jgi:sugar/nucleoside kinase (ribokinase family)
MCVDLVLSGNVRPRFQQSEQLIDDYQLELGGSANIFASQFVKLGGKAGVIGWLGADPFGDLALARLRELRVDVSRVRRHPTLKTGLGVALAEPSDRAILTYAGTIDAVQPETLTPDLLMACRHWHIASFFLLTNLRPHWAGWLRRLRRAGVTASLDTNWDPENRWEGVIDLLPLVDVFLPNEAEALAITGCSDHRTAGRELAQHGPLVIIKRGREGVTAFDRQLVWDAGIPGPEHPDEPIVDTIGAGDNFDAGFLRAWQLGWPIEECLRLGIRCARASLRAAGGIEGQLQEPIARS